MRPHTAALRRALFGFVLASVSLLAPARARADLPRPEGWVPSCTIEKEQTSGGPCEQCRGWKDPDPCQEALAKKGYTRRCTEGGAGSYVAVWCKGPAAPATSAAPVSPGPDNRRGGGCTVSFGPEGVSGEGRCALAIFGVGLAVAGYRRRKKHGPTSR